jgi:hypothetical protein
MITAMANDDVLKQSFLILVIEPDNLARLKRSDPITFETSGLPKGILVPPKYPEKLNILVAYEEDDQELYRLARSGIARDLIVYLMRGYNFNRDTDGSEKSFSLTRNFEPEKPNEG